MPINCRVKVKDGKHVDFRTRIFIDVDGWDQDRAMPKSNYKSAIERLTIIKDKIFQIIAQCERENMICPYEVINRYKEYQTPLLTQIKSIVDEYLQVVHPPEVTIYKYNNTIKRWMDYTDVHSINSISPDLIKGYEYHVLYQLKFKPSTVQKDLECFKNIFKYAKYKGYLKQNLFDIYKPLRKRGKIPVQLTVEEVKRLEQHEFASERLNKVKDCFLFQCYTGLAYIDTLSFEKNKIVLEKGVPFIKSERAKTGTHYFVPVIQECLDILVENIMKLTHLLSSKLTQA
jgi:site-specific recombinase XerD